MRFHHASLVNRLSVSSNRRITRAMAASFRSSDSPIASITATFRGADRCRRRRESPRSR